MARALVVAPHPDDECLGCGGVIALLRSVGSKVSILVATDGSRSHPNSRKYPRVALIGLRERETIAAMEVLGVEESEVHFLGLADGSGRTSMGAAFEDAVARCSALLTSILPDVVFLPWRYDPHPDHQATWLLLHTALAGLRFSPRVLEYPIWDLNPEQRGQIPDADYFEAFKIDISEVLKLKCKAISAYRSQLTRLIDDDPNGFCMKPEMLDKFTRPCEIFFEERST